MNEPPKSTTSISALLSELAEAPDRAPEELLPELRPGDVVAGRFELTRELGRGGFGLVFEARDRELGRLVAFKAIRPIRTRALEKLAKPLKEEAEAAARLNHPNVVTLHDSGLFDGTPFLIMELLRGETLSARLRRGPLPPEEGLNLALQVARGLVAAHSAGVLHRDLKPGNVFLCDHGPVKLVDFGLASIMGRASLAAGTPAYMAPEQFRGEPEDARTDVFSAAVVLFESLTGNLPYPVTGSRSAVLDPGPPPRLPLPDPPPELAALLASALARDRAGRPQDAQSWLEGLLSVERAYAVRALQAARAERRRRVRRAIWAAGALALLIAAGVAAAALRARADAERALRESRLLAAAESASDPLLSVLLLAELSNDPPPRAVEVAQRVLRAPTPTASIDGARGGFALALSPDGTRVAAGLREGTISVFQTDGTGAPLLLKDGALRINDVAWTPDGARLLGAGHDGALHVHPADGHGPPSAVSLSATPLTRVRISPDGRRAAVGAMDGRVHLVDLDTLRPTGASLHDAPVMDHAWLPSGALVTADGAGQLRLVDGRTGATLAQAETGRAALALAIAPDGRLAVGGDDGLVRLLGPALAPLRTLGAAGPAVGALAFLPGGQALAATNASGELRVLPADGAAPRTLGTHREPFGLAVSPDGARLVTFGGDGHTRVWPVTGGAPPTELDGPTVFAAAFTPDGARVVGRTKEGTIRLWPAAVLAPRDELVGHEGHVDTVEWSRDGARLLTAGHDGTIRIWERRTGVALLVIEDPGHTVHSAAWDPTESLVLSASEDGTARIWRATDGGLVRELPRAPAPILFAAWSPDGRRVATAGLDGVVRVHAADGRGAPLELRGHEAGITHVVFSPDGATVISASQFEATVRLWPADGKGPARVVRAERAVYRTGLSPAGDELAVAEIDGPLRLFRVSDLAELPPLQAWPERLWAPAWSPDGQKLALASFDGSVRIVQRHGAAEPLMVRGHGALVSHVAFRPDGREIAAATASGLVRITAVDWPLLREKLASATGACLTAAQRMHLLGEAEAEAQHRFLDCERRHGRQPATPPGPAAPSGSRAGLAPETDRRGT